MTTVLDYVVGEIVNFLQNESKTNLWNNTILVYSTDNGGPQQNGNSNYPLRGNKGTLWQGGVKGVGFITGGWLNDSRRGKQMNALMHITVWFYRYILILEK